jgi:hypothetical protein
VRLGVQIDKKDLPAEHGDAASQVDRRGGFPNASFLIDDGNNILSHRNFSHNESWLSLSDLLSEGIKRKLGVYLISG